MNLRFGHIMFHNNKIQTSQLHIKGLDVNTQTLSLGGAITQDKNRRERFVLFRQVLKLFGCFTSACRYILAGELNVGTCMSFFNQKFSEITGLLLRHMPHSHIMIY